MYVYVIYVEASSSCYSEHFWHIYPICVGNNRILFNLLQCHPNVSYLQITADGPLLCPVVHAAENFLHVFICYFFVDGIGNGWKTVHFLCAATLHLGYTWKSLWIVAIFLDCTWCSLLPSDPEHFYGHGVHLMLWRTAHNLFSGVKCCYFHSVIQTIPLLKSWRQQFCFIIWPFWVSYEVGKFLLCDVVWFARGYMQEKFWTSWSRLHIFLSVFSSSS